MTPNDTEKLAVEICNFLEGKTDDRLLALNAAAGATMVLSVRARVDEQELFAAMREDYRAMVRLKQGGVIATDATDHYSEKGED
jgi:hypothetical protein